MTPHEIAAGAGSHLGRIGGTFMTEPATLARGEEVGYRGWAFYYGGRGGVLGDVDADVVAASMFFIPLEIVRKAWGKARAVGPVSVAVSAYAEICADWGRANLAEAESLERLTELSEQLVAGTTPLNAPLFAGWRTVPRPSDAAGRLSLALHTLREHRGAMHAVAVQAVGMTPLEATATSKLAEISLKLFSWPQPWPEVTEDLMARRKRADELTDELCAAAYGGLSDEEAAEWLALLTATRERLFPRKAR